MERPSPQISNFPLNFITILSPNSSAVSCIPSSTARMVCRFSPTNRASSTAVLIGSLWAWAGDSRRTPSLADLRHPSSERKVRKLAKPLRARLRMERRRAGAGFFVPGRKVHRSTARKSFARPTRGHSQTSSKPTQRRGSGAVNADGSRGEGLITAGPDERNGERLNWRDGCRDHTLDKRLRPMQLRTPNALAFLIAAMIACREMCAR